MFEDLFDEPAVAATDDPDIACRPMGEDRDVRQPLVVDELVRHGQLRDAIEREHAPEAPALRDDQMLMLGLAVEQHPIHLDRQPDVVVQRLGQPDLVTVHLGSVPARSGEKPAYASSRSTTTRAAGCRRGAGTSETFGTNDAASDVAAAAS